MATSPESDPSKPAEPDLPSDAGEILVLIAHPAMEQSRANKLMLKAALGLGPRVAVHDLYTMYPDYLIDVEAEQAALKRAKLVVWQHPIHWYSMPPLLKLWMDDVLAYGWAYGPGGTALHGKDAWLVATSGGTEESYRPDGYNRYFFDAFLPPFEQTAALCGMRFLPPFMLHGSHRANKEELKEHARLFGERLVSYPGWPELEDLQDCVICDVPTNARPAPDAEAAIDEELKDAA